MYKQNDTNAAIRQIQSYLYEISLHEALPFRAPIDGVYGAETQNAVTQFQKSLGLQSGGH